MNGFISETTALKSAFDHTEPSSLADSAWAKLHADFVPAQRRPLTAVTVSTQVPLQPYGTELGFFRRLFRRV